VIHYNTLIVLLGTGLLGANAGLVGCFAVLRRRALTGDALAHAALPGLCLAFLLVGQRSLPALLLGAFATGVLGVATVAALRRWTRIKEDAAIGIVLSVFFGAGITLSRLIQNRSTEGSKAGLDSYILGKTAGIIAQDVYLIAGVSLASLAVVLLLYKEFKLLVFDTGFASVQGWPVFGLDLLLMGLIALAVVFGLPMVGVVLMAALLILPGAAARFWTDRLGRMLAISGAFGLVIGLIGTALSARFGKMPAGPIIVLVGTAVFLGSVLFAPRRGVVGRALAHRRFRRDLAERNLLRIVFDLVEPGLPVVRPLTSEEIGRRKSWSRLFLARLLAMAERDGYLRRQPDGRFLPTDLGVARGAELARASRLWGLFLTEHADLAGALAKLDSESVESLLPEPIVADLVAKLRAEGRMPGVGGAAPREVSA
jgi:manganese/zinc/iron transport system permease protein